MNLDLHNNFFWSNDHFEPLLNDDIVAIWWKYWSYSTHTSRGSNKWPNPCFINNGHGPSANNIEVLIYLRGFWNFATASEYSPCSLICLSTYFALVTSPPTTCCRHYMTSLSPIFEAIQLVYDHRKISLPWMSFQEFSAAYLKKIPPIQQKKKNYPITLSRLRPEYHLLTNLVLLNNLIVIDFWSYSTRCLLANNLRCSRSSSIRHHSHPVDASARHLYPHFEFPAGPPWPSGF